MLHVQLSDMVQLQPYFVKTLDLTVEYVFQLEAYI